MFVVRSCSNSSPHPLEEGNRFAYNLCITPLIKNLKWIKTSPFSIKHLPESTIPLAISRHRLLQNNSANLVETSGFNYWWMKPTRAADGEGHTSGLNTWSGIWGLSRLGLGVHPWKGGVLHPVTYNITLHSPTHSLTHWWGGGDVDEQVSSDTNKFVCVHGWHHQTYVLLKEQYSRSGSTQQSQKATRGELNRSVNLISVFWDEIRAKTGMS